MSEFQKIWNNAVKNGIDVDICEELLTNVNGILNGNDIPFILVFGTLLGAYRDGAFIQHDTDVDIALSEGQYKSFESLIAGGKFGNEVKVIRKESYIISLAFKGCYIDIYFFKKKGNTYHCIQYSLTEDQFENRESIEFLGLEFQTVGNPEGYLEEKYGSDWRTPIKNKHATR